MKYKYIHFEKRVNPETKKEFYACCNNKTGDVLGFVSFYKPWEQLVFNQAVQESVFSKDCLLDIVDFIGKQEGLCAKKLTSHT